MRSGGTWRRLKIAAEVRLGHGIPAVLPDAELVKLLGLLVLVRDGQGAKGVQDEGLQAQAGEAERQKLRATDLREACRVMAKSVDVRPFL
jgi:hypothetical protein